jgi:hypothetical protein
MSQGILFTEPNFHETVEERKKMTRRIAKAKGLVLNSETMQFQAWGTDEKGKVYATFCLAGCSEMIDVYPRYQIGEKVYLKEPYLINYSSDIGIHDGIPIYRYDHNFKNENGLIWMNKMFMPASAARYFIEIANIKVELLQDISDEDCFKEGIKKGKCGNENNWMEAYYETSDNQLYMTPQKAYAAEIDKINGKGTWDGNPYVFAYEYELIKQ